MEGTVEVCKFNAWGTVCHRLWDNVDSRIVCKQLGLPEAGK